MDLYVMEVFIFAVIHFGDGVSNFELSKFEDPFIVAKMHKDTMPCVSTK